LVSFKTHTRLFFKSRKERVNNFVTIPRILNGAMDWWRRVFKSYQMSFMDVTHFLEKRFHEMICRMNDTPSDLVCGTGHLDRGESASDLAPFENGDFCIGSEVLSQKVGSWCTSNAGSNDCWKFESLLFRSLILIVSDIVSKFSQRFK